MAKALPSDATRIFLGALASPGLPQFRQFRIEQHKLDRLLALRAEINSLRSGTAEQPNRMEHARRFST